MTMAARAGIRYAPRRPERRPGPAARALITPEGQQALFEELARLRQELEIEFPERLREAFSFGEARANDDYLQIKEEESVVASRVRQLETLLASTEIVEHSGISNGRVGVGSTVQIEDLASGRTSEHVLTGSHEWVAPADVSANSPIGQAILGREAGEQVTVALPNGRSVVVKVRKVR
jgi:transcription elongation factor GreA